MPALSKVQIWNLGLAKIRASLVTTENENSLAATHCRRVYPHLLSLMLETYEFSFMTRREALTETTNERNYEWLYAYGLPSSMGSPLRLLPDFEGLGLGYPLPLAGEPYAEAWSIQGQPTDVPYIIENNVLYSNAQNATLEYSLGDLTGIVLNDLVVEAIACQLGAWLAMPVKGNSNREKELRTDAEIAWSRAQADDRNRQPTTDGSFISETEAAREGYGD